MNLVKKYYVLSLAAIPAAVLFVGLSACSDNQPGPVSWETQETQRAIAIENSEFNARAFRLKNKEKYAEFNIMGRGDSTISSKCANGDGWASVDLVHAENDVKVSLKCSTASAAIGCLTKADFSSRSYASQEGRCNNELPIPMPRIVK